MSLVTYLNVQYMYIYIDLINRCNALNDILLKGHTAIKTEANACK